MKLRTIILAALTCLITHMSFTTKVIGTVALTSSVLNAQNVSTYTDNTRRVYVFYETNSPLNYPSNSKILIKIKKDTTWHNQSIIMYPGMMLHNDTVVPSNKMVSINGITGQLAATSFSNITLPYSQLTGTPTIPTNNNQLINGAGYISSVVTPTIIGVGSTTVTGTYPSLTINSPYVINYTAGTGIRILDGVISNTTTVITPTITGTGATNITGTYPNLTINTPTVQGNITPTIVTTGILTSTVSGNTFTLSVPATITQTLSGSGTNTISLSNGGGTFVIPSSTNNATILTTGIATSTSSANSHTINVPAQKRIDKFTATTNASGVVTITYTTAFSVTPNLQYNLGVGAGNKETIIPVTSTTTGCSFLVQLRSDVLGLLPTYSNVSGREVNVIAFEK